MDIRLLRRAALACLLAVVSVAALAQEFVVEDIRVEGLRRVSTGTVFNELPITVGDPVTPEDTAQAIRALFATGYFDDVRIERDGGTLVVVVVERPSIASIEFSGNETLETENLLEALGGVGFAVGRTFDPVVLDQTVQEIRDTYFAQGRYSAEIEPTVTPLERHRVGIHFEIDEGEVARIRRINIVGNQSFEEEELLDLLDSTTRTLFSWLTGSDRYSRQTLAADLERIRTHYLDRGFINFAIDSTQVAVTPDKEFIYITINVSEGQSFTVGDVELAGDLIVEPEELVPLVEVREGDTFNRSNVVATADNVRTRLGDEGYAFANVNPVPDVREDEGEVDIAFFVDPGRRVYVRRIVFLGNYQTRDEVLRREMRQLEGAWVVNRDLNRSRQRLLQLGLFGDVRIETQAVPGTSDQVDVIVTVTERQSGAVLLSAGYAQDRGALVNVSVTQENLLGTGNAASFTFNNSSSQKEYGISYTNPYFRPEGISRRLFARYQETDGRELDISDYSTDVTGAGMNFGVPFNEYDRFHVGLTGEIIDFVPGVFASREVMEFNREIGGDFLDGGEYLEVLGNARWSRDSRDRRILPTEGSYTSALAEVTLPVSELSYYRTRLSHQRFFPLTEDWILMTEAEAGYGDGYGGTDSLPLTKPLLRGRGGIGPGLPVQLPRPTRHPAVPQRRGAADRRRLPHPRPGRAHRAAAVRRQVHPVPADRIPRRRVGVRQAKRVQRLPALLGGVLHHLVCGDRGHHDELGDSLSTRSRGTISSGSSSPSGRRSSEAEPRQFPWTPCGFKDESSLQSGMAGREMPGVNRRAGWLAVAVAWAVSGPAAGADLKVGFVDVARVLDLSPQAEEARERIQAEFAPIDQELLRLQHELRDLEESLLRDGDVMSNDERMKLEREVLSRKRDLRRSQEEFREDLNLRRNQELQKLQRQVVLTIRAMAKSEDFDLVISDGVLFASERVDITGTVLERLVDEYERQTGN